ncbi:DUF6053 domain-containing protein [Lysobacter enzymogenes]|uniref:DUF6053 domain-containing protein n=1 Tax=Lysobacter enzymogenes TaxID=69 RepID=UPI003D18E688
MRAAFAVQPKPSPRQASATRTANALSRYGRQAGRRGFSAGFPPPQPALVGGTSVPMLFGRVAAIRHKGIGTEVPPTSRRL